MRARCEFGSSSFFISFSSRSLLRFRSSFRSRWQNTRLSLSFHNHLFISGNTAHSQEKTRKADRNRRNRKTQSKTQRNI